jgi:hypothetical protein
MINKLFLHFSRIYSLIFFLFLCNCASPKETITDEKYKILSEYFYEKHHVNLNKDIKKVLVLTEKNCMGCNAHFSKFIANQINDQSCILLVAASGTMVDISAFTTQQYNNVFFDEAAAETNELFSDTRAILLKNNAVDTIISVKAQQIEQQFAFIKSR